MSLGMWSLLDRGMSGLGLGGGGTGCLVLFRRAAQKVNIDIREKEKRRRTNDPPASRVNRESNSWISTGVDPDALISPRAV